jgi:hypothetical protein
LRVGRVRKNAKKAEKAITTPVILFNKKGSKIVEGNGNITHVKEAPENKLSRVRLTMGPTRVRSWSHKLTLGPVLDVVTKLKNTSRRE